MINDPLDPKSRDRRLKKLSRRDFKRVAKKVAGDGLKEYQDNRYNLSGASNNPDGSDASKVYKNTDNNSGSGQLVPNNLPVIYKPIDKDTCNTADEKTQFNSGLMNDATTLVHLVKNDIDTRHYFQGVLSLASFKDDLDTVRAMVEGTQNLHAPLSPTYLNSNALFNAVLGGAKKTTDYLLQVGADPVVMIAQARKSKKRNPVEAARVKNFVALYDVNSKIFTMDQATIDQPKAAGAALSKFGVPRLKI